MKYPIYADIALTQKCNLNCSFCYAKANNHSKAEREILKLEDFSNIFDQLDELGVMRVGFEGGEPFVREDWLDILKEADKHYFTYFINSNATLIDDQVAKQISETGVDKICVSLDGSCAKIHDRSRRKYGTFNKTIMGIKNLLNNNVNVDGVITLTQYNQDDILNIIKLLTDMGVNNIVIMLLAMVGSAEANKSTCNLSYSKLKSIILKLTDLKKEKIIIPDLSIVPVGEGIIPWELYLPFIEENRMEDIKYWIGTERLDTLESNCYGCTAGKDNFYINAFGDVYGCSMMTSIPSLRAGNVLKQSISEIWNTSKIFNQLRSITMDELEGKCKECEYLKICKAGCRACAYSATNKLVGSDLRCPVEEK